MALDRIEARDRDAALRRSLQLLDDVGLMHQRKMLVLKTSRGWDAQAQLNGDPFALVDELLRLARLGAVAEALST